MDFPGGSDGKVSAYNEGDPGSMPGSGRSEEGNGNLLQAVFLPGKPHGWWSLVDYSRKESDISDFTFTFLTSIYA